MNLWNDADLYLRWRQGFEMYRGEIRTEPQLRVMRILHEHQSKPLDCKTLSAVSGIELSTFTALRDSLARRGYIDVRMDQHDRRKMLHTIGERFAEAKWFEIAEDIYSSLRQYATDDTLTIWELLDRMRKMRQYIEHGFLGGSLTRAVALRTVWTNQGEVSSLTVGEALHCSNGNLSAILSGLLKNGYITSERGEHDRRVRIIRLVEHPPMDIASWMEELEHCYSTALNLTTSKEVSA